MLLTRRMIAALALGLTLASCYPPQVQYPYTKLVYARRNDLQANLLKLLPEEQQNLLAAQQEARWLADTAYKAAAGISRINGSHFPGWSGNALINSRISDRGLCWHYQHDMYRELRRRKLSFFRIGCCVRDKARRSEHNCVYIAAKDGEWPHAWALDAWLWNGRLKVMDATKLDADSWADLSDVTEVLATVYPEEHQWPIEHWYMVRNKEGKYSNFMSEYSKDSPQLQRMYENMQKGYREHPGSPTNY